jgi:hypothetical protein
MTNVLKLQWKKENNKDTFKNPHPDPLQRRGRKNKTNKNSIISSLGSLSFGEGWGEENNKQKQEWKF